MTVKLHRLDKRAVPEQWERELAEISPPTNRWKWLKLYWEEGHPWEPVERYIIGEMVPASSMNAPFMAAILEQLQDPAPPSGHGNYFDTAAGVFVRNEDCMITERAWHCYRETGCWQRPYWVIQGTKGGHKRWFTPVEQRLLRFMGLPTDPPAPGDLPYAEWDERVKNNLAMMDMMRGVQGEMKRRQAIAAGSSLSQESEKEKEVEFRAMLVKWLAEQVDEIAPDVHRGLVDSGAARIHNDQAAREKVWEQAEEDFVQTGNSKQSLITIVK